MAEFPLTTAPLRLEASRVAALHVLAINATKALLDAQRLRATGKGRRPNAHAIERLYRRQGLADQSYSQALDKLREMASQRPRISSTPDDLLDAISKERTR